MNYLGKNVVIIAIIFLFSSMLHAAQFGTLSGVINLNANAPEHHSIDIDDLAGNIDGLGRDVVSNTKVGSVTMYSNTLGGFKIEFASQNEGKMVKSGTTYQTAGEYQAIDYSINLNATDVSKLDGSITPPSAGELALGQLDLPANPKKVVSFSGATGVSYAVAYDVEFSAPQKWIETGAYQDTIELTIIDYN